MLPYSGSHVRDAGACGVASHHLEERVSIKGNAESERPSFSNTRAIIVISLKLAAAVGLVVVMGGWAVFHHRSAEARTRRYFGMGFSAQVLHRQARIDLAQEADDLRFGEPLLHRPIPFLRAGL
jgi:hypothetical protein